MGVIGPIIAAVGSIASSLLSDSGGDGGDQAPPGNPQLALLAELMSSTAALDALFQNAAAREDPTLPNLLNAQLSRLADIQGGGGFDAGNFLSGDFSSQAPSNPLTLGGADGSFNIPLQQAGGIDPIIQALIDNILTPATVRQGIELGTPLTELSQPKKGFGGNVFGSGVGGNFGSGFRNPGRFGGGSQDTQFERALNLLLAEFDLNAAEDLDAQEGLFGDILGGTAQQGPAPPDQPVGAISGSFQQGGTVPFDGNFQLHQGEQVVPTTASGIPALPVGANTAPPPIMGFSVHGGRGDTGDQHNAFDPLPPGGGVGGGPGRPIDPGIRPHGFADEFGNIIVPGGRDGPTSDPLAGTHDLGGNPAPIPGGGGTNPLQDAIAALLGLVQGGGPITPQIANQQQQRISDVFGQQLASSQRGVQENFGARGLGGSGIEAGLGLEQALGLQENAALASNQLAVQQALQNFQGVQGAAQGLGGLSLGAGQFGLQQQQLAQQQEQSLFQLILQALQGTFAPGSGAQTLNIV